MYIQVGIGVQYGRNALFIIFLCRSVIVELSMQYNQPISKPGCRTLQHLQYLCNRTPENYTVHTPLHATFY